MSTVDNVCFYKQAEIRCSGQMFLFGNDRRLGNDSDTHPTIEGTTYIIHHSEHTITNVFLKCKHLPNPDNKPSTDFLSDNAIADSSAVGGRKIPLTPSNIFITSLSDLLMAVLFWEK